MQQPISEDNNIQHKVQVVQSDVARAESKHEDQLQNSKELSELLGLLMARFSAETGDDLDMLDFSLHHLFYRLNSLYRQVLPGLAFPPYIKLLPSDDLPYYCHTWNQLELLRRTLTRLEALAHMLTGATTNVLDTLDTASAATDTDHSAHAQKVGSWETSFITLSACLNNWQHVHAEYRSFSTRFVNLLPSVPNLAQMDQALDTLLNSACFLYGTILHDLLADHTTAEQTAMLLLDLMQQSDLLLQAIDMLMDPLHALMKYFALAAEMY